MTLNRIVDWLARRSALQLALILALVAEIMFLANLGQPNKLMFDETHYVAAARATFGMVGRTNEEHPLFAKWLIGLSMALSGDTPWGWRVLSTVAGTATMLAIFAIALRLFGDRRAAATAALIAMLNQMLFIQARIAMLDVFMGAFLFAGIAFAMAPQGRRSTLIISGLCLGLAVGCKWAAIPYVALVCAGVMVATRRIAPALWIGGTALAAYFATFAPALGYADNPLRLDELIPYQAHMYALQTQPLAPHTYMSKWWQWPLITRPIWYLYEPVDGVERGVLLVGNPAIMWGGLIAVGACAWAGLRQRATGPALAAMLYLFAIGLWIVIPKKIGFYYYYYLPALCLSLALAGAFHHYRGRLVPALFLAVSAALFLYFLPIISSAPLPNDQAFLHWMWFSTWP